MRRSRTDSYFQARSTALALVALACVTSPCMAQPADKLPDELEGVGVTEHLDTQVPLDLQFVDEDGRQVQLSDYFDGHQPVILTLNYYRCPMLCTLQLNGMIEGLRELNWTPGKQFRIVTVSIDPTETPSLAKAKKKTYLSEYERPSASAGWHFLTGKQKDITALAEAVGFGYRWNPKRKQWMHTAALFLCTPEGKLSRYLYGVQFDASTLKLSLVEASAGKIGSSLDQIILYCYQYDASEGRYGLAAMNVMRAGGGLTAALLGLTLATFWMREARRRRIVPAENTSES